MSGRTFKSCGCFISFLNETPKADSKPNLPQQVLNIFRLLDLHFYWNSMNDKNNTERKRQRKSYWIEDEVVGIVV